MASKSVAVAAVTKATASLLFSSSASAASARRCARKTGTGYRIL